LALVFSPERTQADMFGGDVAVLIQILSTTLQELAQLRQLLSTGEDTLDLLKDVNRGLKEGLNVVQIINPRLSPGIFGNLDDVGQLSEVITQLYGPVPKTADFMMQTNHDKTVAESLSIHSKIFKFADEVDSEKDQILSQARLVNPQGAGKLQNQALAILIGVATEILRTNSAMLKLMAENFALQNRKEKLGSEQFQNEYEGISKALSELPENPKLSSPTSAPGGG
jgi:hypothetical protein